MYTQSNNEFSLSAITGNRAELKTQLLILASRLKKSLGLARDQIEHEYAILKDTIQHFKEKSKAPIQMIQEEERKALHTVTRIHVTKFQRKRGLPTFS